MVTKPEYIYRRKASDKTLGPTESMPDIKLLPHVVFFCSISWQLFSPLSLWLCLLKYILLWYPPLIPLQCYQDAVEH